MAPSSKLAFHRLVRVFGPGLAAALLLASGLSPGVGAAPHTPSSAGELDSTFGGYGQNGRVLKDWIASGSIRAAVALPDGTAIVVGSNGSDFLVGKYQASGEPDTSFGAGQGWVAVDFGGPAETAHAVAIDSNGQIVVGGTTASSSVGDFALARLNPNGTPDLTFDTDGRVTLDFNGRRDTVFALAFLPGSDILAAGGAEEAGAFCVPNCNSNFGLARFNPDGGPDTGFAGTGRTQTDLGGSEVVQAVTYDSTGGLYAVGSRFGAPSEYVIARYMSTGALRTGFGGTGVVTGTALSQLVDVELLTSNAIVALGNYRDDVGLIRYDENGALVDGFGTDGVALLDFGGDDRAGTLSRLSDSTLVVGGSSDQRLALAQLTDAGDPIVGSLALTDLSDLGTASGPVEALSVSLVHEVRLWTIGTVPTDQGLFLPMTRHFLNGAADNGGRQATDYDPDGSGPASSNDERAGAAAFQPDGMLLVAGGTDNSGNTAAFLTRYTADGALDPGLGGNGMLTVDPFLRAAVDLAVQADGRILVAGQDFDVARLDATGSPDLAFNGGYANANWADAVSAAMVVQSDGKPVLAGYRTGLSTFNAIALVRFTTSGLLDPDFGNGGQVITGVGLQAVGGDVALQADGKIIVAGAASVQQGNLPSIDFALVRYHPDGSLDTDFGVDGKVVTDFGSGDGAYAIVVQPDGKIVAAGMSVNQGMAFARYLPTGALDTSFSGDGKLLLQITGDDNAVDLALDGTSLVAAVCDETTKTGLVVRLTQAGVPDASFNGNGRVPFAFAGNDCPYAVAARSGRIAAAGYAQHPPAAANPTFDLSADFAVAVYESGLARIFIPLISRGP